jgi:N-acetylmuramoyl-L-alanine amidase
MKPTKEELIAKLKDFLHSLVRLELPNGKVEKVQQDKKIGTTETTKTTNSTQLSGDGSGYYTRTKTAGWGLSVILVCSIGVVYELTQENSIIRRFSKETFEVLTDPQVRERWRRGTIIVTEEDVDIATRTLIGEANGQPLNGKVAVAHVIINRARIGSFGGNSLKDVALSKARVFKRSKWVTIWQFEPWMHENRRNYLNNISRNSSVYQEHKSIVEKCLNGTYPDPTEGIGGATYFLNPNIVVARSGRLPGWASGSSIRIGEHVFFRHADQLTN